MVPKTKTRNRIVASAPAKPPVTLRDLLDREIDPRRQTALRRLAAVVGAPLETMPAKIDWTDARLPKAGFEGAKARWAGAGAYRRWHSTVRSTIRRHAAARGTSNFPVSPLRMRHMSVTTAHDHSPAPADQVFRHTDIALFMSRYANFRATSSDPKSD